MNAILQDYVTHHVAGVIVHDTAHWDAARLLRRAIWIKFHHVAGVTHKNVVARNTTIILGNLGVVHQHVELAVVWQIKGWMKSVD